MSGLHKLVVFDQNAPLYADLLKSALRTEWDIELGPNSLEWLRTRMGAADAAIGLRFPPELLGKTTKLGLFLFPGAGVMNEDPDELPDGCHLCNVYEHEISVSEYVYLVLLAFTTNLRNIMGSFQHGEWLGNGRVGGVPHGELFGKRLGLVGFGHIGIEVARRAGAFGMHVQAIRHSCAAYTSYDPRTTILGGAEALPELLSTSDFVVIACPLNSATRGWIGREQLSLLQSHAFLVNVSRAEIIVEDALFEALDRRTFAGAALDVWYRYPSTAGERLHGSKLPFHLLPNVLATPHFSAWTPGTIARRAKLMADNLDRLVLGQPLQRVVMTGSRKMSCN
jgi:phosphoglycerate dehydrogenase-like enzyme